MIEYYAGIDGPSITRMETEQDLYDALDAIHSMCMDGLGENHPALTLLEHVMNRLVEMYPEVEPT